MLDITSRNALIDVALGHEAPDLTLINARLVNVLSREVLHSDIAIKAGRIAAVAPTGEGNWRVFATFDVGFRHVAPGFIDLHVRVESSMVTVGEYARATTMQGVTMILADPHEIGNVLGIPGMRLLFDEARTVAMRMMLRVPARIPATPEWVETSGAHLDVQETAALMEWP